MPYKRHPYKGLPGVPNLRLRYIVAAGQLRRQGFGITGYKDETVIDLSQGATTEPPKGFLKGAFNHGNVGVTVDNNKHLFRNVQDVRGFIVAIESKGMTTSPPDKTPWYDGLTGDDLEDDAITIPNMSDLHYWVLRKACDQLFGGKATVGERDWVKQGDVVFAYNGFVVVAPVTGRIEKIGFENPTVWDEETQRPRNENDFLFKIKPQKGQYYSESNAIRVAYAGLVERIEDIRHSKRLALDIKEYADSDPKRWAEYMKAIDAKSYGDIKFKDTFFKGRVYERQEINAIIDAKCEALQERLTMHLDFLRDNKADALVTPPNTPPPPGSTLE